MMVAMPFMASEGKNLKVVRPSASPASISVGVMQPGTTGRPSSWQCFTTAGLKPGVTIKSAPAALA